MQVYSLITKLTLSSEPSWGTAFRAGDNVKAYQQSLFWLVCRGLVHDVMDLNMSNYLGMDIISYRFPFTTLKELLDLSQVPYFIEEDQVRWVLPHNVSPIFYTQWKCQVVLSLNNQNIDCCA